MDFKILTDKLIVDFTKALNISPVDNMNAIKKTDTTVNYFEFCKSVSSVYSSKIEGEDIDFDSYFKHKFLKVQFKVDYTKRADDLFEAYNFIQHQKLSLKNVQKAHSLLSQSLLSKNQQGLIRRNPMFVINQDDKIEYIAATPEIVQNEVEKLFKDIELLQKKELTDFEIFYYASLIHLVFVKIHPFQDGNGRAARLIEKWFLIEQLGSEALAIPSEKNYYTHQKEYYTNIRKAGIDYSQLDYSKCLDFLLMTAIGILEKD